MVYEWEKVELYGQNNDGDCRRYTIADGVSVSKGALLYLTDPRTASGAALGVAPVAGVAAEEHLAGQGVTSITCWTNGIFDVVASAAIMCGASITADSKTANTVIAASAAAMTSGAAMVIGYALEEAGAAEKINVRLLL